MFSSFYLLKLVMIVITIFFFFWFKNEIKTIRNSSLSLQEGWGMGREREGE